MFHIAGIIISLFLALLLFTKRGKAKADMVLAIWLTLTSFHLLAYYILASGSFVEFPYFLGIEIPIPLIHGPFLYLYVANLTSQLPKRLPWFIHFLPAFAAYLLLLGFYTLSFDEKIFVYQNNGVGFERLVSMIRYPIVPSGLIYIILSLFLLRKHRENISRQFSYIEKINLNWLVYLTIGMASIWLSIIFGNDISTFILVDSFILFIGYFGIKQVGIFSNQLTIQTQAIEHASLKDQEEENESSLKVSEKIKYQKTSIGDELLCKLHDQLTRLMLEEKLYTDPELHLDQLAERLEVSANNLSQVINSKEERNFYDYINNLRVEEFKQLVMLPENNKFTLLTIAYEAGFNSKTSFNRNFKKATGLSPREFCQQEKIQLVNQTQVKETILPFGTSE